MKSLAIVLLLVAVTVYGVVIPARPFDTKKQHMTKGLLCNLCKDFVKELTAALASGETNIKQKAYAICHDVSGGIAFLEQVCKDWVDDEWTDIMNGINNHYSPDQVCTSLDAC